MSLLESVNDFIFKAFITSTDNFLLLNRKSLAATDNLAFDIIHSPILQLNVEFTIFSFSSLYFFRGRNLILGV